MISITSQEFDIFGCPNCGCDSAQGGSSSGCGRTTGKCRNCELRFEIRAEEITEDNEDQYGSVQYATGRTDENSKRVMEKAFIIPHPRIGVPAWHWEPEDIRPAVGEYWESRGPGYPDVSGFVKTKQAGERILAIVHKVLGAEKCKTFLDFRPSEPLWIQFKFHRDEFDIDMLDDLGRENGNIITEEIIQKCKL